MKHCIGGMGDMIKGGDGEALIHGGCEDEPDSRLTGGMRGFVAHVKHFEGSTLQQNFLSM